MLKSQGKAAEIGGCTGSGWGAAIGMISVFPFELFPFQCGWIYCYSSPSLDIKDSPDEVLSFLTIKQPYS